MEVILLERVEKLGQMGDVVNVRPGYARNYLLPQKKALRATSENRSSFEERRTRLEAENLEHRAEAQNVAEKLEDFSVVIVRQASDNDHLYGSVTTRDIAGAVCEAGVTVDRRQIQLDHPIKTVGLHQVRIRLHPEVAVEVTTNVARSEEEAEMQARGESVRADQDADIEDDETLPPKNDDVATAPEEDEADALQDPAEDAS